MCPAPLEGQAELLKAMFPEAKQVGLLDCSSEVNSSYQVRLINDVFPVTQSACQGSDVIFVPTDNTIASCTELICNVMELAQVPVIGGDEGICAGCGVATICIGYYALGHATGEMACDILVNGADVAQMPIAYSPTLTTVVNSRRCQLLGIAIPDGYQPLEN